MSDEILLKIATQSLALAQKNKMYGTITFHLEGGKLTRKETKQSERLEVNELRLPVSVAPGIKDPHHMPKLHEILTLVGEKHCHYQVVEVRGTLIVVSPVARDAIFTVQPTLIYRSYHGQTRLEAIKERFTGARSVELAE